MSESTGWLVFAGVLVVIFLVRCRHLNSICKEKNLRNLGIAVTFVTLIAIGIVGYWIVSTFQCPVQTVTKGSSFGSVSGWIHWGIIAYLLLMFIICPAKIKMRQRFRICLIFMALITHFMFITYAGQCAQPTLVTYEQQRTLCSMPPTLP